MGLLVYPLIQGQPAGWPAWTYLMGAGSALSFGLLVAWSRRQRRVGNDPLVEASIFSHRPYTAGLATIIVFFAGMIGTLLVLTLFLQFGEHFTAIHAGLTLAPFAVGTALGATVAGAALVPRFGRIVLQAATLVIAGGVWWLHEVVGAHGMHTGSLDLIAPQLVVGLGIGMTISPLFDFILAAVTPAEVGSASGVLYGRPAARRRDRSRRDGHDLFRGPRPSRLRHRAQHCLIVELATTPVLLALISTLPSRARESEANTAGVAAGAAVATS